MPSKLKHELGFVKKVKNFLLHLEGLPSVKINDLIQAGDGSLAVVTSLKQFEVEAFLLIGGPVRVGTEFVPTGENLKLPVGEFLLGRAVSPLGRILDSKGGFKSRESELASLDKVPVGISGRKFINKQLETGISLIDVVLPIAKGQRELILGEARSGKTGFVLDVIANQKGKDVICVYASVGKPTAETRLIIDVLSERGAMEYTCVVASFSSDLPSLIFLTPAAAFAVAEYFALKGKDVLVIVDDIGYHAKTYREISLLSERSPGRESYPGDIFFQHARILERAGCFDQAHGNGSITALPVMELELSEFTAFAPTNLMAMTDGHLLFKTSLYNQGRRPSIDIFLSVSRVGQQSQVQIQKALSIKLKQILGQGEQLGTAANFSSELPPATRTLLMQHDAILELFKQAPFTNIPKEVQVLLLALPFSKFGADKTADFYVVNRQALITTLSTNPQLGELREQTLQMTTGAELVAAIDKAAPILNANLNTRMNTATSIVDSETWLPKY